MSTISLFWRFRWRLATSYWCWANTFLKTKLFSTCTSINFLLVILFLRCRFNFETGFKFTFFFKFIMKQIIHSCYLVMFVLVQALSGEFGFKAKLLQMCQHTRLDRDLIFAYNKSLSFIDGLICLSIPAVSFYLIDSVPFVRINFHNFR